MPDLIRHFYKIALFACCFSITFVFGNSPASAQGTSAWQRYVAMGESFSVMLPEQPLSITIARPNQPSDSRLILGRIYSAYADGKVFLVFSLDNWKSNDSFQDFTKEFQSYLAVGKEADFETDVKVSDLKGKQYRFQHTTSVMALNGVAQYFVAKGMSYVFVVIGEDVDKPVVKQFLSSIRLNEQGKAQAAATSNIAASVIEEIQPPTSVEAEKVYTLKDTIRKAVLVSKPSPMYTEEARRNQVTGTVVLRAIFDSRGYVRGVKAIKGLPDGLTEKAIIAARNIRFIPAMKDGRHVSQYFQIEYNFNLY